MSKLNVPTEWRQGRVSPGEMARFARESRQFANQFELRQLDLTTAKTNTATVIYLSDPMDRDEAAIVDAWVIGQNESGTQYGAYELTALFRRVETAAAAQQGATQEQVPTIRSDVGLVVTLGVDTDSSMYVKVNDGNLDTMIWRCWVEVRRW